MLALAMMLAIVLGLSSPLHAEQQLTQAFPYQGALSNGGVPASGAYYFEFALYDDAEAGQQVGPTLSFEEVPVVHGVFTVGLDFGEGVFNGRRLWLETRAGNDALTSPTVLLPRRELMATPYALYSLDSARVGGITAEEVATKEDLAARAPAPVAIITGMNWVRYVGSRIGGSTGTGGVNIILSLGASYDPAGGPLEYAFDFGTYQSAPPATFSASSSFFRNPHQPGIYRLNGWVRNSAGLLGVDRMTVEVRSGGGIYTVDAAANGYAYCSMADINGNPAIAYYDTSNQNLKFVRALNGTGSAWGSTENVATTGNVGQYASLANVSRRPAIAYHDASNGNLMYVRALYGTGSIWGLPVIVDSDGVVGQWSSLHMVNRHPAIAYYDVTNGNLKFVRALDPEGTSWDTPVVVDDTGDAGLRAHLRVGEIGARAQIVYADSAGDIRFVLAANDNGSAWNPSVVVHSTGISGSVPQFSFGHINTVPTVVYSQSGTWYKQARFTNGSEWLEPAQVDFASSTDIVLLEAASFPTIFYHRPTSSAIRFARPLSNTWTSGTVQDGLTSLATHGLSAGLIDGGLALAFCDPNSGQLKFAR